MNRWYVINTKPLKENNVSKMLSDAGYEMLNPRVMGYHKRIKPMFPNYIFIKSNFNEALNYHLVKYTRGVNKVLGTAVQPVSISDEIIQIIQERLNSESVLEQNTELVGKRVRIRKGILKDLVAVIEKPMSSDGRVAVLLRLYEREMRTKMTLKDMHVMA